MTRYFLILFLLFFTPNVWGHQLICDGQEHKYYPELIHSDTYICPSKVKVSEIGKKETPKQIDSNKLELPELPEKIDCYALCYEKDPFNIYNPCMVECRKINDLRDYLIDVLRRINEESQE